MFKTLNLLLDFWTRNLVAFAGKSMYARRGGLGRERRVGEGVAPLVKTGFRELGKMMVTSAHVLFEVALGGEGSVAEGAPEGSLFGVAAHVDVHRRLARKHLATHVACRSGLGATKSREGQLGAVVKRHMQAPLHQVTSVASVLVCRKVIFVWVDKKWRGILRLVEERGL